MEIRTEYHRTQKTLFRRVNQIRRANGICDFEAHRTGYRLLYCDTMDMDAGFLILNDKGAAGYVGYSSLADMLKVGLTANAGHQKRPAIEMSGETSELIKRVPETLGVLPIGTVDDGIDKPVQHLFTVMEQLLIKSTLKEALDHVAAVGHYSNRRECNSLRTHHVVRLPGAAIRHDLPQLRFGGRWLERAGFDPGQEIKIITINGMILIVPIRSPFDPFREELFDDEQYDELE